MFCEMLKRQSNQFSRRNFWTVFREVTSRSIFPLQILVGNSHAGTFSLQLTLSLRYTEAPTHTRTHAHFTNQIPHTFRPYSAERNTHMCQGKFSGKGGGSGLRLRGGWVRGGGCWEPEQLSIEVTVRRKI